MELPQDFCCGVSNLLHCNKRIHLHEAIQIALRGAEKLDTYGELKIFLGGVFLLGVGGKLDEELS